MTSLEARTIGRVRRRLIPFLALMYLVAYVDRVNVGFAALQMNAALGFSQAVFGFGAGIFFIGYFLFEVPSNLILDRVGARLWIARIAIVWGLVSMGMSLVVGQRSFYSMRFLLGAAEAGFYPGIIYYFTCWFPARERARAVAQFAVASMVAGIVGAPLSGILLSLDGIGGLGGWQWLFVAEGIPAVVLGVIALRYLTDRPEDARWLADEERACLIDLLRRERDCGTHHVTLRAGLSDPKVWLLASVYFLSVVGAYGFNFFIPQIVKELSGASNVGIGLLTSIPYLVAATGMIVVAAHSDRTGERRWHAAGCTWTATAGLAIAALAGSPLLAFAALCVAALGIFAFVPPFWSLPTLFLRGTAAAAGIAMINATGNLGGFVGPYLMGWLRDATGSFAGGLLVLACAAACSGLLVLTIRADTPASAVDDAALDAVAPVAGRPR